MSTFLKWQQQFVKGLGADPVEWLSSYGLQSALLATSSTLTGKEEHRWKRIYLHKKLRPLLEEQDKLKEAHQDKLNSLQKNLDIITSREKKARERIKKLEIQINKLRDEQKKQD